jgi:site-specific DNA-methyltransferase (adenine-specific)
MKYPDDFINKIICGDCLEVMKDIPDNSIDLTVTSPPYDNLRSYKGYTFKFEETANELYRVTKIGGVIVWVVGDETINGSETGTSFKQALYFKDIGFNLHDTMIYQKNGFRFPFPNRYHQVFEYMFIFCKGNLETFNPINDRKNIHTNRQGKNMKREKDGEKTYRKPFVPSKYGKRYNVWEYNIGGKKNFNHPAIFPEKLAQDHILSWSNENDIVLDPMCGSGTTCKMAKLKNRKYIGIEISPEYCEIARKRVNATPEPLFVEGGNKCT